MELVDVVSWDSLDSHLTHHQLFPRPQHAHIALQLFRRLRIGDDHRLGTSDLFHIFWRTVIGMFVADQNNISLRQSIL